MHNFSFIDPNIMVKPSKCSGKEHLDVISVFHVKMKIQIAVYLKFVKWQNIDGFSKIHNLMNIAPKFINNISKCSGKQHLNVNTFST